MRLRPSVPAACAAVALLVALPVATGAAPALAAEEAVPAAGTATSAVTLLSVAAAGHDLAAGGVRLLSDTAAGAPAARVVVTPLVADGTSHGEQTVEAGTTRTVDAVSSSAVVPALKGIAELTGPALTVGALTGDGTATSTAGADSLGGVSVLGLPVQVAGVLKSSSAVGTEAAQSTKTLEVTDVALPSIADLLAALGLDLSKLPVEVVDELVAELDLATPAVAAANKALDDAQALVKTQTDAATAEVARQVAAVDAATKDLAARTAAADALTRQVLGSAAAKQAAEAAVTQADTALAARQQAAAAARSALAALPATVPGPLGSLAAAITNPALAPARAAVAEADALVAQAQAAATEAATALAAAGTAAELQAAALAGAKDAVALAQAALDAANRLLDAAQKALADVVASLAPQVQALLAALTAVLDGTPLVRLDAVSVSTESVVTSALFGGQTAGVEGGELRGLEVLGTDVLDDVLGSSSVSVTGLTGSTLQKVTDAVDGLTGTLSEVLSTVPGLPTLKVPAPQVGVLTSSATTGVDGAFGTATTTVTGLQVTLPAITLPAEVALPQALQLPGLSVLPKAALPVGMSALTTGDLLTSTATTIGLGTLTETARFRPATAAVPVTGTSGDEPGTAPTTEDGTTGDPGTVGDPGTSPVSLPRTGASQGLAVLALVLAGGAAVLRRRELVTR